MQIRNFGLIPGNVAAEGIDEFNKQQTAELRTALNNLHGDGGGDGPEDVFGALRKAANLAWSSRVRYAILITDSPPHGARFINKDQRGNPTMADDHPKGSDDADNVFSLLVEKQVELVLCHVNRKNTAEMAREMGIMWLRSLD
eukprot:gene45060-57291_t